MKRQSGFTLVEIAIVLVVVGLLLGGVLKGQELVVNARIRSAINEFNSIASASFAYQDRYRSLPGDDPFAAGAAGPPVVPPRWPGAAVTNGNGNGIVGGTMNFVTGAEVAGGPFADLETGDFWQHLRNDRLVVGNLASLLSPVNSFDGRTGVITQIFGGAPPNGIPGQAICHSNVILKAAQIIDTRIDDGSGNTGTLLAGVDNGNLVGGLPAASTAYGAPNNIYVICREL
jgi:prepilin-type N-terminal cleavage/methylation domain-containing protein